MIYDLKSANLHTSAVTKPEFQTLIFSTTTADVASNSQLTLFQKEEKYVKEGFIFFTFVTKLFKFSGELCFKGCGGLGCGGGGDWLYTCVIHWGPGIIGLIDAVVVILPLFNAVRCIYMAKPITDEIDKTFS